MGLGIGQRPPALGLRFLVVRKDVSANQLQLRALGTLRSRLVTLDSAFLASQTPASQFQVVPSLAGGGFRMQRFGRRRLIRHVVVLSGTGTDCWSECDRISPQLKVDEI